MRSGPKCLIIPSNFRLSGGVACALAIVSLACEGMRSQPATAEIQAVLADSRRAHLETDASLIAAGLADTVFSIDEGQVVIQTRDQIEAFFRLYFDGAVYHAWEDVTPPVISISSDGSMAWVARTVRVDREEPGPGGQLWRREFTSAYTATYENTDAGWKMTSVTSTFLPGLSDGQRVLAAMRRALGGERAVTITQTLVASAHVEGPSSRYEVVTRSTQGGRVRLEFSTGFQAAIIGGDSGWVFDGTTGIRRAIDDVTRTFVRGHEFHMSLLASEYRYGEPRFTGEGSFQDAAALRLTFLDALGAPVDVFLSPADSLPLGMRLANHTGRGAREVTVVFSRWEALGDLRLFRAANVFHGDDVYRYEYRSLEANVSLPDGTFKPPE